MEGKKKKNHKKKKKKKKKKKSDYYECKARGRGYYSTVYNFVLFLS